MTLELIAPIRRAKRRVVSWFAARPWRAIGLAALVLAGVVALSALVWRLPSWQVEQTEVTGTLQRAKLENEYRRTLAQIVGGLVILGGLYLTYRRIRASEETARAAQVTARAAAESQITERFTRAIEHLGDERLSVQLGGIYALKSIAEDSQKYHPICVEVLCAFVREQKAPGGDEEASIVPHVQAAMTVLGGRYSGGVGVPLDLHGAFLRGVQLDCSDLRHANLAGANLTEANLCGSDLYGADLRGASLLDAQLHGADLRKAKGLTGEDDLYVFEGDSDTLLPDNLTRPEHWKHAYPWWLDE